MGGCMEDTYQYCVPEANEDMNVRGVARVAYGTVKRRALALAVVVVSGGCSTSLKKKRKTKKQTSDLRFGGSFGDARRFAAKTIVGGASALRRRRDGGPWG